MPRAHNTSPIPHGGDSLFERNCECVGLSVEQGRTVLDAGTADAVLQMSGAQLVMSYQGRDVYQGQDPVRTAWLDVQSLKTPSNPDIVVFFGFGIGLHARMTEARFEAPVLVFDPCDQLLGAGLGALPLSLQRTRVLRDLAALTRLLYVRLALTDRRLMVAAMPGYRALFPEQFEAFKEGVRSAIGLLRMRDATQDRALEWSRRCAQNLPVFARLPPVQVLEDRFANKPGILVGAGPSLDRNVKQLRDAVGRSLIVATNASLRILARAGITPDLVVIIEATDVSAHFEGIEVQELSLVAVLKTFPGVLALPFRHRLSVLVDNEAESGWFRSAYGRAGLAHGGCVGGLGLQLLHALNCDPIIMVGMDLALPGGQLHGSIEAQKEADMRYDADNRMLVRPGDESPEGSRRAELCTAYGGEGEVLTVTAMNSYRMSIEQQAIALGREVRLVNATEGGARIAGFEETPLREAISVFCNEAFEPRPMIDQALKDRPASDLRPLHEFAQRELDATELVARHAHEAACLARHALQALQSGQRVRASRLIADLQREETALGAATQRTPFLCQLLEAEIGRLRRGRLDDACEDKATQTINSLRRSCDLFELTVNACAEAMGLLRAPLAKLCGPSRP